MPGSSERKQPENDKNHTITVSSVLPSIPQAIATSGFSVIYTSPHPFHLASLGACSISNGVLSDVHHSSLPLIVPQVHYVLPIVLVANI